MASCCVTVDYLAAAIFGQLLVNYFKLQLFQKLGFYLFILYNRVNLNIPHTIFLHLVQTQTSQMSRHPNFYLQNPSTV